jgi:hypothetical protein
MYLSTLRNYIHAMGGVLQIQAIFPDGGAVVINRFGDYEDRPNVVSVCSESGVYRLHARPLFHQGVSFSTKAFRLTGLLRTMKALHLAEPQISALKNSLETAGEVEIAGMAGQRVFSVPDLVAAGFEAANSE